MLSGSLGASVGGTLGGAEAEAHLGVRVSEGIFFMDNIKAALKGRLIGSYGGIYTFVSPFLIFDIFAEKTIFLVRVFRIHPVQSVVNNITQLSGR